MRQCQGRKTQTEPLLCWYMRPTEGRLLYRHDCSVSSKLTRDQHQLSIAALKVLARAGVSRDSSTRGDLLLLTSVGAEGFQSLLASRFHWPLAWGHTHSFLPCGSPQGGNLLHQSQQESLLIRKSASFVTSSWECHSSMLASVID